MKPIEQKDLDVLIKIQENNAEIIEKVKKINAKIEQIVDDEEYTPKESQIKNKEIRKIIRLWTKVNGVVGLTYNAPENSLTDIFRNEISFNGCLGLEDGCFYTTKELCGESEE